MAYGQNPWFYGLWSMDKPPWFYGLWSMETKSYGPMVNGLWTNPHGSMASGLWRQKPMVLWPLVYGRNPMVLWRQKRIDSIGVNPFSSRSGTRTRVSTVRGWRANRYTNRPFGYISGIQPLPFEARLFPVCECKVTNKFSLHQIF